jgi:hypothetical protein
VEEKRIKGYRAQKIACGASIVVGVYGHSDAIAVQEAVTD